MKYLVSIHDENERSGSYWRVTDEAATYWKVLTTAELNALLNPEPEPPKVGTWAEGWLCDCTLHHRSVDRCYSCHTLRPPFPDVAAHDTRPREPEPDVKVAHNALSPDEFRELEDKIVEEIRFGRNERAKDEYREKQNH